MATILRKEFVEKLKQVAPALGVNVLVPAFQCFRFDGKQLAATDGVLGIVTILDSDCGLKCSIPGPAFFKLLDGLKSEEVEIFQEGDNVIVQNVKGTVKGTFVTISGSTSLKIPDTTQGKIVEKEAEDFVGFTELLEGLNLCRYSASKDSTMGSLCGVRVVDNFVYSTDKHRVARYNMVNPIFDVGCTLSIKFVNVLLKYRKELFCLSLGENAVVAELRDNTTIFSTILTGEYKDLGQYIPENTDKYKIVEFPEQFGDVLERHLSFLSDVDIIDKEINVDVSKSVCMFKSVDSGLGELEESLELASEVEGSFSFPINPLFLKEVSKVCKGFYFSAELALVLFKNDNFVYLVKPKK